MMWKKYYLPSMHRKMVLTDSKIAKGRASQSRACFQVEQGLKEENGMV